MKNKLFIIVLVINFSSVSQIKNKIKFGFGLNLQSTIIENLKVDSPTLKVKQVRQPIGFTLCISNFKYVINNRFFLESSFDIISLQGVRYYYFGSTYSTTTTLPQINLGLSFCVNKFLSFYLGGTGTVNTSSNSFTVNDKTDFYPKSYINRTTYGGVYFLPELRLYLTKKCSRDREIAFYLSFTKGIKKMSLYTQNSFSPNSYSSFEDRGTKLKLGFNWYFKIKK